MKRIDGKFMAMGIVFLLAGLALSRILMITAGAAFIIYSFSAGAWRRPRKIFSGPSPY
ncbi:hypothetical protein STRDD11_00059 [Streptococcus sp. DD11]|nr:hypothetical protein [Streptococcus sp. DD11]KXT86078.1 hypothetical protein STRDD11_00059 [Streptococcus sp. DD11]